MIEFTAASIDFQYINEGFICFVFEQFDESFSDRNYIFSVSRIESRLPATRLVIDIPLCGYRCSVRQGIKSAVFIYRAGRNFDMPDNQSPPDPWYRMRSTHLAGIFVLERHCACSPGS